MAPTTARSGVTLEHAPRPLPTSSRMPAFDDDRQFGIVLDNLMTGEQLYGVYASDSAGITLAAVTNRRVILQDAAFAGGRSELMTVPFSRVTTVGYVAGAGEPVFSSTVAIQVGRTFYEVTCRDRDRAAKLHDLIVWHLLNP